MAEFVPRLMQDKSFIRSKENLIVSYDWTDTVNNLGYIDFYFHVTLPAGGGLGNELYSLVPFNLSSGYAEDSPTGFDLRATKQAAATATQKTLTFTSSSFNKPIYVQGKIYFNVGYYNYGATRDNEVTVTVYHVNAAGTVETSLGSGKSQVIVVLDKMCNFVHYIECTGQLFAVGEYLKVTIMCEGVGGDTLTLIIAHDPANGDWSDGVDSITPSSNVDHFTNSKISIPVRIDN